jgi:hypothetical protein
VLAYGSHEAFALDLGHEPVVVLYLGVLKAHSGIKRDSAMLYDNMSDYVEMGKHEYDNHMQSMRYTPVL